MARYLANMSRSLLTHREQEILGFVATGLSARQIAQHIDIAPRTVERHIENIRQKMHARNSPHMIFQAFNSGELEIVAGYGSPGSDR